MSILNQVKSDQLNARKARDSLLAAFLTTLFSDIARVGLDDGKRETTDNESIKVLRKYLKNSQEVKSALPDGDARIGDADYEILLVTNYLPMQISDEELKEFVENIAADQKYDNMRHMGTLMKNIEDVYSGRYDGKIASGIVRAVLS